ncbi:MAG: electron transfer flavoprotein subunit alpha/FixB family protein [Candidatus Tectomicrobia bacterium]|nr:electron transfer flavoprotein subunit alpha/FixB family protein [Candidatus Tectomicrobia bacterium]
MPGGEGVLVIGELSASQLSRTSKEILAAGRLLADNLGEPLALGLLGSHLEDPAREAFSYGADRVYTLADPLLEEFQVDLHLTALESLCKIVRPRILLMGRTTIGREVAPRLACRLGVGLAQDCLEVKIDRDTKKLLANRPVYGGNAIATLLCTDTPQFATIRPKAYDPLQPDESRRGEVVPISVQLDPSMARTRVVSLIKDETEGVKLEEARVVVAGGRGLGGPEPFRDLEELARALGAGIGASRAAVDAGWVPPGWQIGLTGKTITPDLYITIGISGASQHMAGCSGAGAIVAINKDPEANIFKEARFGAVGDWKKILPAFTKAVQELMKQ